MSDNAEAPKRGRPRKPEGREHPQVARDRYREKMAYRGLKPVTVFIPAEREEELRELARTWREEEARR